MHLRRRGGSGCCGDGGAGPRLWLGELHARAYTTSRWGSGGVCGGNGVAGPRLWLGELHDRACTESRDGRAGPGHAVGRKRLRKPRGGQRSRLGQRFTRVWRAAVDVGLPRRRLLHAAGDGRAGGRGDTRAARAESGRRRDGSCQKVDRVSVRAPASASVPGVAAGRLHVRSHQLSRAARAVVLQSADVDRFDDAGGMSSDGGRLASCPRRWMPQRAKCSPSNR